MMLKYTSQPPSPMNKITSSPLPSFLMDSLAVLVVLAVLAVLGCKDYVVDSSSSRLKYAAIEGHMHTVYISSTARFYAASAFFPVGCLLSNPDVLVISHYYCCWCRSPPAARRRRRRRASPTSSVMEVGPTIRGPGCSLDGFLRRNHRSRRLCRRPGCRGTREAPCRGGDFGPVDEEAFSEVCIYVRTV